MALPSLSAVIVITLCLSLGSGLKLAFRLVGVVSVSSFDSKQSRLEPVSSLLDRLRRSVESTRRLFVEIYLSFSLMTVSCSSLYTKLLISSITSLSRKDSSSRLWCTTETSRSCPNYSDSFSTLISRRIWTLWYGIRPLGPIFGYSSKSNCGRSFSILHSIIIHLHSRMYFLMMSTA